MSANCEYYQALMSRMLDGDLMKAETDALREHIRTCRECRMLCAAFSSLTLSLRDDTEAPPASLAPGVMSRIRTYESEKSLTQTPEPAAEPAPTTSLPRRSHVRKKSARWQPVFIAACLVLVIGGIGVTALNSTVKSADSAEETAEAPAAYSRDNGSFAETESAPAESAVMEEMPEAEIFSAPEAAAPAAGDEPMAMAEEAQKNSVAGADTVTVSSPDYVPEGFEDAFDALLTDAGERPDVTLHTVYAVERNGVIYEFLTDESEAYLFWQDAAEGFPILSRASVSDLWDIFG